MKAKRDKVIIERFLQEYNDERGTSYKVVDWPDEGDRTGKVIDALAADGAATLAIEHTLLQPFAGERQDTAIFLKAVGKLDKAPHLMVPGFTISLSLEVGAIPKGVDWSSVGPAVEAWYLSVRDQLPTGRSQHAIPDLAFGLTVNVDKAPVKHDRGFFFIERVMPSRPLRDTVEQALQTKVDKLAAATADKHLLLLEKYVPIYGDGEVGELIDQLQPQFPNVSKIDEAWIANTVAFESEDALSIELTWPVDAAEERDYERNDPA
jgi:hypothetical protein